MNCYTASEISSSEFMRIHKSFIVSIKAVNSMDENELLVSSERLPMREKLPDILTGLMKNDRQN